MTWALLPVKDLVKAKTRLAGVLAPHERRALAQAMVEDVLVALTGCGRLQGVLMVSDDPGAELLAYRYGVELMPEWRLGCRGLNAVIAAACRSVISIKMCCRNPDHYLCHMVLSSPEVQRYRQRKISFYLLLETQGHLSSLQ